MHPVIAAVIEVVPRRVRIIALSKPEHSSVVVVVVVDRSIIFDIRADNHILSFVFQTHPIIQLRELEETRYCCLFDILPKWETTNPIRILEKMQAHGKVEKVCRCNAGVSIWVHVDPGLVQRNDERLGWELQHHVVV